MSVLSQTSQSDHARDDGKQWDVTRISLIYSRVVLSTVTRRDHRVARGVALAARPDTTGRPRRHTRTPTSRLLSPCSAPRRTPGTARAPQAVHTSQHNRSLDLSLSSSISISCRDLDLSRFVRLPTHRATASLDRSQNCLSIQHVWTRTHREPCAKSMAQEATMRAAGARRLASVCATPPSSIVEVEDGHEGLLRHTHLADGLHALLALCLLVEELLLARDIAAVALGGDVLPDGRYCR